MTVPPAAGAGTSPCRTKLPGGCPTSRPSTAAAAEQRPFAKPRAGFSWLFPSNNNLYFGKNLHIFLRKDCDGVVSTKQGTVLRGWAAMPSAPRVPAVCTTKIQRKEKEFYEVPSSCARPGSSAESLRSSLLLHLSCWSGPQALQKLGLSCPGTGPMDRCRSTWNAPMRRYSSDFFVSAACMSLLWEFKATALK